MSAQTTPDNGWPLNRDAFGLVLNLAVACWNVASGTYWMLPLTTGLAMACCVSQVCATIAAKGAK